MIERLMLAATITVLLNVILNLKTQPMYSAQQAPAPDREAMTLAQRPAVPAFKSILKLGHY